MTPTGAAIVAALRTSEHLPARYRIEAVGYGAGSAPTRLLRHASLSLVHEDA
ncbi:MAG: nickel insertion protein [Collinsella sp.]